MSKKIVLPILIAVFLPSFAFAAWYNPLTWFKKAPVQVDSIVTIPEKTVEATDPVKPQIINNVRTITVSDPKLQQQVDDLIKQTNELIVKVNELNAKNAALQTENVTLNNRVNRLQEVNDALKQRLNQADNSVDKSNIDVTLPKGNVQWSKGFPVGIIVYGKDGKPTTEYPIQVIVNGKRDIWSGDSKTIYPLLPRPISNFVISIPELNIEQSFSVQIGS